nr:MAG: hypothetical protein DIU78_04580 [Pseudomonadota bacterium]
MAQSIDRQRARNEQPARCVSANDQPGDRARTEALAIQSWVTEDAESSVGFRVDEQRTGSLQLLERSRVTARRAPRSGATPLVGSTGRKTSNETREGPDASARVLASERASSATVDRTHRTVPEDSALAGRQ